STNLLWRTYSPQPASRPPSPHRMGRGKGEGPSETLPARLDTVFTRILPAAPFRIYFASKLCPGFSVTYQSPGGYCQERRSVPVLTACADANQRNICYERPRL